MAKKQTQNINNLFKRFKDASANYPNCMISLQDNKIWVQSKEGMYISQHESTNEFVNRLNAKIQEYGNDEGCEVTFDYAENEIIVTKDGFPLFF